MRMGGLTLRKASKVRIPSEKPSQEVAGVVAGVVVVELPIDHPVGAVAVAEEAAVAVGAVEVVEVEVELGGLFLGLDL